MPPTDDPADDPRATPAPGGPIPAVPGWFTLGDEPRLVGNRCGTCTRVFFPPRRFVCGRGDCPGDFDAAPLSRTGRIWSVTDSRYAPPAPYVVPGEAFEPFAVAAVQLDAEGMVVLGQLVPGVGAEDVRIGDPVELVVDTLFTDGEGEHVVWKWRPTATVVAGEEAGR